MKVLTICASAELGGTERVLIDLARWADPHGLELTVVVPRDGPIVGALEQFCRVVVVPAPRTMLAGSQRGFNLLGAPLALAALPTWARRIRRAAAVGQDLVYATGFKPYLAAAFMGITPVVWHLHEHPPRMAAPIWFRLARTADSLIANSATTANAWTSGRPLLADKTQVILNGVDLEVFRPRDRSYRTHDELGLGRDAVLVGMPAAFARWKGQIQVVDAFERMAATHPEAHLVLVGGCIYDTAAERSYDRELATRLARTESNRVHRLDFKGDIESYLPDFDLIVHYSLRPEAFGRVVVEAMATGVPVIAAAEGGPLEILGATQAGPATGGWLCEPRDPGKLAVALGNGLQIGATRLRAVGLEGRRRVEQHFSSSVFADRLATALLSLKR